MGLTDRVIAISGAAGGLGRTATRTFAEAGAKLALAGRDRAGLAGLLEGLGLGADRGLATAADLGSAANARAWAGEVLAVFGRVDAVLHLVGGFRGGSGIGEITDADWQFMHDSLILTTLNVARAFIGPLKASGRGRFIAVTSPFAQSPTYRNALYAMAKASTNALVLALADELKGSGGTANAVVVRSILVPDAPDAAGPRKGTPASEIAGAMAYLCSDDAASVTGVLLPLLGTG